MACCARVQRIEKREAALALGDWYPERAFPVLLDLLRTTGSAWVRNGAALGLRDVGDPAAAAAIIPFIRDPETADSSLVYALETLDAREGIVALDRLVCRAQYSPASEAITALA
ncbi:MAG: HEAT repeat domain-containing protein, partial [Chloroflexi bacterium]|nr:HEAT repeat domain-containing protein [Chloroflexota bacterium]